MAEFYLLLKNAVHALSDIKYCIYTQVNCEVNMDHFEQQINMIRLDCLLRLAVNTECDPSDREVTLFWAAELMSEIVRKHRQTQLNNEHDSLDANT